MEAIVHVPKIIVECIKFLESDEEYMKTTGLYRVSGDYKTIQSFRYNVIQNFYLNNFLEVYTLTCLFQINLGQYEKLKSFTGSPHEITGLMKLFIRELKKPLMPSKLFNTYIPTNLDLKDTSVNVHDKIYCLVDDMRHKPEWKRNYATLEYLIKHLKK